MNPLRGLWLSAVFLLILLAAYVWLSPHMPAVIATHWNAQGQINGYMTPFKAMLIPLVLIVALALLTLALPAISPRGYGMDPFGSAFAAVMVAVQAFVLVAALGILMKGAGFAVQMPLLVMIGIGLLWMVIGNYMGKFRKNFFAGIRTPWTLSNDEVWERTHRMAGWLFMITGLITVIAALVGAPMSLLLGVLLAAAFIPMGYSYVLYKKLDQSRS